MVRVVCSAYTVHACFEKLVQDIVFIGRDHQFFDGQTHLTRDVPCTNIAKIARWHGE